MKTTLKKLQDVLKKDIEKTPFDIEIDIQDGAHTYIAKIFWPHKTFPPLLFNNRHKEIHSVENGRICIEFTLDRIDGGPMSYEDANEYYENIRIGFAQYIEHLAGIDRNML